MNRKISKKQAIKTIENFVKKTNARSKEESHGFSHVDRVRKWALKIGRAEGRVDLFLLEATALLHDIGKPSETKNISHYVAGEKIARKFLTRLKYFSKAEIDLICLGVRYHGIGHKESLVKYLQDADRLDLWGAVAVGRSFSSHYNRPYYIDKESFQSQNWTPEKIGRNRKASPWHKSVLDVINFCLDTYKYANTKTAKCLSREKIKFLRQFVKQFKKETLDL